MGYLPEEEKSYKEIKAERDAKKAALTASLRTEGETEVGRGRVTLRPAGPIHTRKSAILFTMPCRRFCNIII